MKQQAMIQLRGEWFNATTFGESGVFVATGACRRVFYTEDLEAFVIY